jgi:hypothetical protein
MAGFGQHLPLGANVLRQPNRGDFHPDIPFWADGIRGGIYIPHHAYDTAVNLWIGAFRIVRIDEGNPPVSSYLRTDRAFLRACRAVERYQRRQGHYFPGGGFPHHIAAFTARIVRQPWARECFRRFIRYMFDTMMGPAPPGVPPVPMS